MNETHPITDYEYIQDQAPPDLPNSGDRVELMRDRLESIRRNYKGKQYFRSRITGIDEDKISIVDLKQFEVVRFHRHEAYVNNLCWPVDFYLSRIKELEDKIKVMGGEV